MLYPHMRVYLLVIAFTLFLGSAQVASAQFKSDEAAEAMMSQSKIYGDGFSLNKLFDPQFFQMRHSLQMSFGSGGGGSGSIGEYTNSMMWRFSQKLAARVDVGVAQNLFGNAPTGFGALGSQNSAPSIYLKNVEVAYQPLKNMTLHVSFRRAPRGYGYYASPYGYYGNTGYGGYSGGSALIGFGGADRFAGPLGW
ncbi:MAG: hypothetical protein ACC655_06305 [Rhodothermia bacterium]